MGDGIEYSAKIAVGDFTLGRGHLKFMDITLVDEEQDEDGDGGEV